MSSDWIKIRCGLHDEPEVVRMATMLKLEEDAIVGKLIRFWALADQHTKDGHFAGLSSAWLDGRLGCPGIASALATVGWLAISEEGVRVPKFDRHNGMCAKRRAENARRMRVRRTCSEKNTSVRNVQNTSFSHLISSSQPPKDSGSEKDIAGADVERLRRRLEGRYDSEYGSLIVDIRRWGGYGEAGAEKVWNALPDPKRESFEQWVRYGEEHGKAAAKGYIGAYTLPGEIPREPTPSERKERQRKEEVAKIAKWCSEGCPDVD